MQNVTDANYLEPEMRVLHLLNIMHYCGGVGLRSKAIGQICRIDEKQMNSLYSRLFKNGKVLQDRNGYWHIGPRMVSETINPVNHDPLIELAMLVARDHNYVPVAGTCKAE